MLRKDDSRLAGNTRDENSYPHYGPGTGTLTAASPGNRRPRSSRDNHGKRSAGGAGQARARGCGPGLSSAAGCNGEKGNPPVPRAPSGGQSRVHRPYLWRVARGGSRPIRGGGRRTGRAVARDRRDRSASRGLITWRAVSLKKTDDVALGVLAVGDIANVGNGHLGDHHLASVALDLGRVLIDRTHPNRVHGAGRGVFV